MQSSAQNNGDSSADEVLTSSQLIFVIDQGHVALANSVGSILP